MVVHTSDMEINFKSKGNPQFHYSHSGLNEDEGVEHLQGLIASISLKSRPTSSLPMAMEDMDKGFSSLKYGQDDIKRHLCRLSDIVVVGIKDNREIASDVRYMSNQIGCHDSHIDDHDRDLKELMGTMDIIKEEVMKLAKMNQCSHWQESLGDEVRPME